MHNEEDDRVGGMAKVGGRGLGERVGGRGLGETGRCGYYYANINGLKINKFIYLCTTQKREVYR